MRFFFVGAVAAQVVYVTQTRITTLTTVVWADAAAAATATATASAAGFPVSTGAFWDTFWDDAAGAWTEDIACRTEFVEALAWDHAVAGRPAARSLASRAVLVAKSLEQYLNPSVGAYSASTAKDTDIYNDDNAQLIWVLLDVYDITSDSQYLERAKNIMDFLKTQTDANGGVIWKYESPYIASISTSEAALAAVKLYAYTKDTSLLTYAAKGIDFMVEYFQDDDGLFFDGMDSDYTNVNTGKLSYTVGCAMSTLSLLYKHTNKALYKERAIELAKAATNQDGALYNGDSRWNNQLMYVYLLYVGLGDVVKYVDSSYTTELLRQGAIVRDYLADDARPGLYFSFGELLEAAYSVFKKKYSQSNSVPTQCGSLYRKTLIDNGAVQQILAVCDEVAKL